MDDAIEGGYALNVLKEHLGRNDDRVKYIPHYGVYHPKKKKICIVFKCTATYRGVSLNDQLLQRPNLATTLVSVLTKFRQEPMGMMADVKSMSYLVKVPQIDADLLCFFVVARG